MEPSGFAGWASRVGARATELVEFVGSLLHFLGEAARAARRGVPGSVLIGQVYEVGARSLPLTAVAAFAMGVVMAIQTMVLLKKFGVFQRT